MHMVQKESVHVQSIESGHNFAHNNNNQESIELQII